MVVTLHAQSGGEAGIAQTLSMMAGLINAAITDPNIRNQAAYAISGCPRGDRRCQCAALLSWVNRSMRYVPDPKGVEALHDPRMVALALVRGQQPYGDCDDLSMYLAALLKSIGLSPILRAVGYNGKPYQHVYVVCDGATLDPTRDAWVVTLTNYHETSAMERHV